MLSLSSAGAQTTAASSAFGESVSVSVLPLLGSPVQVTSGPLPSVHGSAPAPYDLSGQLASLTISGLGLGPLVSTKILTAHASSPFPAADQASAEATVNDLDVRLAGLLPLLTVKARTLHSSARIDGPCSGVPTVSGPANLTGLRLGGTLGLGLTVAADPAPNTVLLDLLGIRVVLNERIVASPDPNLANNQASMITAVDPGPEIVARPRTK